MSAEFKREEPYIVFKVSDLGNSLKGDEIRKLAREYAEHRKQLGKKPLECVVIEKDWPEYEPTWQAIEARVTGAQPVPSEQDAAVRKAWSRFSNELHRSPDAPYPGMSEAFEQHFSQSFIDREWRAEAATWAAAWKAAKRHGAQPESSVPDGWKLVPIEPTTEIRKAMHYAYWQSPQLPYHDGSPELWNAAYAAMLAAASEA